jgi:hypothetical protein
MWMDRKMGYWLALAVVVLTPHVALAQQFAWFKYQKYEGWIEDTDKDVRIKLVPFLLGPDVAPPPPPGFFDFNSPSEHQSSAPELSADGRIKLPYLIVREGGLPQSAVQAIAATTGVPQVRLGTAPREFVQATYDRVVLEIAGREVASDKLGGASLGGQVQGAFYVDRDRLQDLRDGNYRLFLDYTHPIANFSSLSLDLTTTQISRTWVEAFREVVRSKTTSGGKVLFMDFSSTVSRTRVKESVRSGGLHQGSTSINVVMRDPTPEQLARFEAVLGFAKLTTREQMLQRHQAGFATALAAANPALAAAHEKYIESFTSETPNTTQQLIDALSKLKDSEALQFMAAGFQMREFSQSSYYRYDYSMMVTQKSSEQTQYREYLIRNASVTSRYFAQGNKGMAQALDAAVSRVHLTVFDSGPEQMLTARDWVLGVRRTIERGDRRGLGYAVSDGVRDKVLAIDPDMVIDNDGNRLLHFAARRRDRNAVEALLAAGASAARRNQAGDTPADAANDADDTSLRSFLQKQANRRGTVKITISHFPQLTQMKVAVIAPQDVPGTTQRIDPRSVQWSSTDAARLARLTARLELDVSLTGSDCQQIRFTVMMKPVSGGCMIRVATPMQLLVRYPADGTNEYRMRLELADWNTGFRVVPDND